MINKKILGSAMIMAFTAAGVSTTTQAALTNGSTLNLNSGVETCVAACASSSPVMAISSGSYFAMDMNGNGIINASEKGGLGGHNGLILGTSQAASGAHTGASGTVSGENPGIDAPWNFAGSTGMDFTVSPSNVLSASGNQATVDLSGWRVTWNTIAAINMGGGAWNPRGGAAAGPYYNGVANVVCGVDCGNGDTYALDYSAVVPLGDPSGFGGTHYFLHLEGTVSAVPVPAAFWLFGSGLIGLMGFARRKKI